MNKNYTLLREESIPEISGVATYWEHISTGAQIVSIANSDENKCFGVTFRTPPEDSTGVAHILEHSVLCGSEKYPTKEPFVELLKGSLQTFLNAFTFPDKTCYPVASTNLQDFYNLIDVYTDAVFFPLITESTFQQEGWHLEIEDPEHPLIYKGVVFNEMKGVYSSPDSILMEKSQQSLFPEMLYSIDSGGDPAVIPKLTYANFKKFHETHYHPTNARFFFWGDDPVEERLNRLLPLLSRFSKKTIHNTVPIQQKIQKPVTLTVPYSPGENANKEHVTFNWLLCQSKEIEEVLLLEMLEHILLGLPGSPLRKALIESGLGEDITGTGFETDLQQTFFSVGLRSIEQNTSPLVEKIVFDVLQQLSKSTPKDLIEAAVNSTEFDLRENNSGRFPRGLVAMLRSLTTWLYDGDPLAPLQWEQALASIKKKLASGTPLFEKAIQDWFLDNKHYSKVILVPDQNYAKRFEDTEKEHLQSIKNTLSPAEIENLIQQTANLKAIQQRIDSPEALASIPSLTLDALPRENKIIPCEITQKTHIKTLVHNLDTSGILYADILLPLEGIPEQLIHLVPLFARSLTELGTTKHSFVELGLLVASKTGGVGASSFVTTVRDTQEPIAKLCVSGKATKETIPALFSLFEEILLETQFDNQNRLLQMALEERARLEQALIPAGHSIVMARLRAPYSLAGHISEELGGITYLEHLKSLIEKISTDWNSVLTDLKTLQKFIVTKTSTILNLTGSADILSAASPFIEKLEQILPNTPIKSAQRTSNPPLPGEVLQVPSQVNYVGKGCNIYKLGYTWHGSAHVITRYLRMAWLWDQVRVQGGAYGAFCALDRMSGSFSQVSYRDPNIEKTLATFDGTSTFLHKHTLTKRELMLAIIGAIGDLDSYMLPDAKGMASLTRHITHDKNELRQQMREEILSTTQKHFTEFAEAMAEFAKKGTVCILGGANAAALAQKKGWSIHPTL